MNESKGSDEMGRKIKMVLWNVTWIFCLVFLISLSSCQQSNDKIPAEFEELYNSLDGTLNTLHDEIDHKWDQTLFNGFLPMASVLPANSNAGPGLVKQGNFDFVKLFITRLKEMGCKGVQLDIQFPILDPEYFSFAKSQGLIDPDSPDDNDYMEFYIAVVEEIRRQNLRISIECQVIFTQETWSPLPVEEYYQFFDKDGQSGFITYKQRKLEQLKRIVRELAPDYLTICNEPETEIWLTGIQLLQKKENYFQMIKGFVSNIEENLASEIMIGSGYGIWSDEWRYWAEKFNELKIDFTNIHIYAIDIFPDDPSDNTFERILEAAGMAHDTGKKISTGETWLYKRGEDDPLDPVLIYGRDYFDFWQPLDQKYLSLILKIAHYKQFEFVSPFWSQFFFSYLSYEEAKDLSTADRKKKNNQQTFRNVYNNIYSETGNQYSDMIKNGPK